MPKTLPPDVAAFLRTLAAMNYDGEDREEDEPFVMDSDDAIDAVGWAIVEARRLLG